MTDDDLPDYAAIRLLPMSLQMCAAPAQGRARARPRPGRHLAYQLAGALVEARRLVRATLGQTAAAESG